MPDKVIVLNEGAPWGFRMTGGKSTGSPLKISRVNNAGKAAKAGVREGFLIESINSAPVDNLTSNEAQALIRNSGDTLTIGVYRQSKSHSTKQNNEEHKAETKAAARDDKSGGSKQPAETETPVKKSKRVRKRRRKKKRAELPEQLNDKQSKTLPVEIVEQQQEPSRVSEHSTIEIIPATPDLQVDELEWIKKNEALLIAELETRRQAGLPIQVVVKVEKITPSKPEYCQIIPDFCHLEVIKEETSASDEDRNRDVLRCLEENKKSYTCKEPSDDWNRTDVDEKYVSEPDNILEVDFNDIMKSEYRLERLESPSLVRDSEILKFADVNTTENKCAIELDETLKTLNSVSINLEKLESNEHFEPEMMNVLNNETYMNDYNAEDERVNKNQGNFKNIENQIGNNHYYQHDRSQVRNDENSKKIEEYSSDEVVYYQKNRVDDCSEDECVNNADGFHTKSRFNNYFTFTDCKYNGNTTKNDEHTKNVEALPARSDGAEREESSSDDSTIKQCQTYNYKYKTRGQNKVSVNDKLKQIARFLQDDTTTDDYAELPESSRKSTSARVSVASDADVDTDWVSFTLSDGESSRSLCLSPAQLRSGRAPSTASETSGIIDLHRKFVDRTKGPDFSPRREDRRTAPVEILSYGDDRGSPPPPSKSRRSSYSSEVLDEACRMCGTSDEPLSDAECLVSLRRYRETRSRLLDVIQMERPRAAVDRSVAVDRPRTQASMQPAFIDTLSVPDHRTRELMYAEYMDKVKERENRLRNKVMRITKSGRPLSSGALQALNDIDAEFVAKARERLEKLRLRGAIEPSADDADFGDEEYYPKHLVDIVPADQVCVEEVHTINGVWSPELKHKSPEAPQQDIRGGPRRTRPERKPSSPSSPPPTPPAQLPPVWTPGSSPTPERKTYKPVRFESPTPSRKKNNAEFNAKIPPKSPIQSPSLSLPPPPPPPPAPTLPLKTQGDENVHSTDRRLPRVQSPTVTLLQKAREGQLPKGSAYLDAEEYNMDKENKIRGSTVKRNVESEEKKHALRYDRQSDEKKPKKMVEIGPKKYEGIGPTTKEGVPIVLRSEIKEPNQPRWYKQMYESLHKFQSDDEGVTVRYKTLKRDPKAKHGDGYLSEPEKGYESDYGENRLFQNGGHAKHVSVRRSVSPVKCGQDRYKNQPRPIENYEPGHSSIAEKEAKHFWDEVMNNFDGNYDHQVPPPKNRSSSKKSNLAQALKESGYNSDSTLVFKRRENQPECLSPTEQKTAYKVIQNGGEIPFQGLRKTVPDRPKDSPHKYAESEVTLQYRRPVRSEIKEEWSEEELVNKQAEAMRRIYQEERRRKYLQELQDMSNRRHADNLLPSQKSPIPLNRYDDFLDESPQPPRSRTPEPKLVARALYNFVGQTSRELSFRKGDIIFVRKQVDKNWYEGEHNAMVGLFPFNYVEVIPYDGIRTTPHRPYEGQARAKFNFMAQTNMELSLVKGELVVLTRRVDNNWYEGRIGSRKGIFPVSYVTVLVEPGDHPNASVGTPFKPVASPAAHSLITSNPPKTQHMYQPDSYNTPMPTRNSGTQTKKQINNNMNETLHVDVHSEPMPYRALYNYKPQNSDELELREGDVVFVMEKCDDGWYVGSSKRTGCFGTFPGNYVQRSI